MRKIEIAEGCIHIGARAFSSCPKLEVVFVPSSVGYIGDDAFEGSEQAVIVCSKDSYAQKYARVHGLYDARKIPATIVAEEELRRLKRKLSHR